MHNGCMSLDGIMLADCGHGGEEVLGKAVQDRDCVQAPGKDGMGVARHTILPHVSPGNARRLANQVIGRPEQRE